MLGLVVGVRVGHNLVPVFAAMLRHLARQAAWVGERAGRHVDRVSFPDPGRSGMDESP